MLKFAYLSKVGRRVFLAGLCIGFCVVSQADEEGFVEPEAQQQEEGESISDSFSNIWNKVSTAVAGAAKVSAEKVKDVSVDVGHSVSDTAVSAWDKSVKAYNDYNAEDENDTENPVDSDKLEDFGSDEAPVETKAKDAGAAVEQPDAEVPPIPQKDAAEKKN